jgi:hypothetical protein
MQLCHGNLRKKNFGREKKEISKNHFPFFWRSFMISDSFREVISVEAILVFFEFSRQFSKSDFLWESWKRPVMEDEWIYGDFSNRTSRTSEHLEKSRTCNLRNYLLKFEEKFS